MNVYKLSVSDWDEKPLDREVFEADTGRQAPWYVSNDKGGFSFFAVCPGCDNPIQIIGFYHLAKNTDKPYARHYPRTVPRLAVYQQDSYDYCPYAGPKRYDKAAKRAQSDPLADKILDVLVPNFDRVIYILEKVTGLKITDSLAEVLLKDYRDLEGHRYIGATLQNIPWVFAYMTNSKSLTGRIVTGDDELLQAVENTVADVVLNGKQITPKQGVYVKLDFCFIHHRSAQNEDGGLKETMVLQVSYKKPANAIYQKTIEFDRDWFKRLIRVSPERAVRPRKATLVALAEQILGSRDYTD